MSNATRNFREFIVTQPRNRKRALLVAFDAVVLMAIVWASYSFRFERLFIPNMLQLMMIVLAPVLAIPIFIRLGLYRAILRYLPDRAVWTIARAVTLAVLLWVMAAFALRATGAEGVPRSIALFYWVSALAAMEVSRFGARWLLFGIGKPDAKQVKTVVVGSGDAGLQLINALQAIPERRVVGFLTTDLSLHGMDIAGVRVSPIAALDGIVSNMGIDEVILTSGTGLSETSRRDIIKSLTSKNVRVRVLPPLGDIATGRYLVGHLRDVEITDLLGREPVKPDLQLLRTAVEGKTILITGAAGSIGSALAAAVADLNPRRLILLDTNEHGIFEINRRIMRLSYINPEAILGSVDDANVVRRLFETYEVDTVYHCAAYKHVALAESNLLECIRNNVFGTYRIAEAASKFNIKNFVLISTDKAVRPAGVMGATKRWAELVVRHFSELGKSTPGGCTYATVRFGNVLGSSGSVVPLFQEQIARGGPITLTDENMTRYFMSIEEAAELILQAGVLAETGDIIVLEMGEPVRIRDLAENMIALAGRGEIEIVVTGAKEGEKIHEELFYDRTSVTPTSNPRILRPKQIGAVSNRVPEALGKMRALLDRNDHQAARQLLFDVVG